MYSLFTKPDSSVVIIHKDSASYLSIGRESDAGTDIHFGAKYDLVNAYRARFDIVSSVDHLSFAYDMENRAHLDESISVRISHSSDQLLVFYYYNAMTSMVRLEVDILNNLIAELLTELKQLNQNFYNIAEFYENDGKSITEGDEAFHARAKQFLQTLQPCAKQFVVNLRNNVFEASFFENLTKILTLEKNALANYLEIEKLARDSNQPKLNINNLR
ncbi:MAG: hypothetical protein SFW66_02075 [Gammaproteobacteria bacterium]|nr:hypothetical protein [Gammaproteobacteria bacterium]